MMNKYILIISVILLLTSCNVGHHDSEGDEIVLKRLDVTLADYASLDGAERTAIRDSLGDVIDVWLNIQGIFNADDSALIEYSKSRAVAVFSSDICSSFENKSYDYELILKLQDNISNCFGGNEFYDLYSVVSPYNQSIFIADSMMFIGLNHYLGSDYVGYDYFEPYQRVVKTPQHLVYDIAEAAIVDKYPYQSDDEETVLNVLLYNGAIVYSIMQLVPDADIAEVMGYTQRQLEWAEDNEKNAWSALISRKLLYSTNRQDANRLVNPSPVTSILHQESPGRLGRYIGYKIVKSYVENHQDVNLKRLLSPDFYNSLQSLIDSEYGV